MTHAGKVFEHIRRLLRNARVRQLKVRVGLFKRLGTFMNLLFELPGHGTHEFVLA